MHLHLILEDVYIYWSSIVILILLFSTTNAIVSFFKRKFFKPFHLRLFLFGLIFSYIQIFIGLTLYLISPKFNLWYEFSIIKVIKNKEARFFLLEYPLTNLLMVFLITVGWSLSQFTVDSRKKFLRIGIFYGLGFIILIYRTLKLNSI